MELSLSLHKDILEARVGALLNKIHFGKRRNIMFFEGIFAEYVRQCEKAGYGDEMYAIGKEWFSLLYWRLVPPILKKLPHPILFPRLGGVWKGIGALDGIAITEKGGTLTVETKNEAITRCVGRNMVLPGAFAGAFGVVLGASLALLSRRQTKTACTYVYRVKAGFTPPKAKEMALFRALNEAEPQAGFTMKDALRSGVFQLKGNKLYFRGALVTAIESTIFQLVNRKKLMLGIVPGISYSYFNGLVDRGSSAAEKLRLLKTLLQATGWGTMVISGDMKKTVVIGIRNPPYGLQQGADSWEFLAQTILGYLWLLDRRFKLASAKASHKRLALRYAA